MKKTLLLLLAMCATSIGYTYASNTNSSASASMVSSASDDKDDDDKDDKDDDKKSSSSSNKYSKTFIKNKKCITAKGDFMTLHKVDNKLYAEIPIKYLGREVLIASTVSETSDANLASIGYKPTEPIYAKFVKMDTTIYMTEVSLKPEFDTTNKELAKAIERTTLDPIINAYKIFCVNPDTTAYVIDMTSLFTGNDEKLAPLRSGTMGGGINMTASFSSSGSALSEIKAFEDNVSIKSFLTYKVSANLLNVVLLKRNEPVTVSVTRTILLLPEEKMRPRIADSRVGIFLEQKIDMDADKDQIGSYAIIKRWNLQPKDTAAFLRGELVEPIKPIVFYLDDAFPAEWREPAIKGITRWNAAFEKIGFKNVVQIVDYPKDDPNFDPDNLKYSCIRYVPSSIANAMGPSWSDPSTGEIINASVIVYNDIVKLINGWRFTQTAQIDPRVRAKRMPKEVVDESIAYILGHEVGHCLGFMHNMAASAAFPVDSLRSASFTEKYGTTPSIMDYARFNYVAQPGDKGVKLTPPQLGVYDEYLIKYAYAPILEANTTKEEAPILESWVDAKAGDPRYRYGRQQIGVRYDPSAIEEDLGDDPIKASKYGVENLKYIVAHLNEWFPDSEDTDASHKQYLYESIANQYNRYLKAVMLNVGGIYLTDVKAGTKGVRTQTVDAARQREALEWVVDEIKNCQWIADREITDKFNMRIELPSIMQYYTALELFNTHRNVMIASHVTQPDQTIYGIEDWFDDMFEKIWVEPIKNKKITTGDIILQKLYVILCLSEMNSNSRLVKVGGTSAIASNHAFLPSVDHIATYNLDMNGLASQYIDELRAIEEEKGIGYVASQMDLDKFGPAGYGWQYRLNLRTIDDSKEIFYRQAKRIEKLIKGKTSGSSPEAKHYSSMLYQIQKGFTK